MLHVSRSIGYNKPFKCYERYAITNPLNAMKVNTCDLTFGLTLCLTLSSWFVCPKRKSQTITFVTAHELFGEKQSISPGLEITLSSWHSSWQCGGSRSQRGGEAGAVFALCTTTLCICLLIVVQHNCMV